MKTCLHTLDNTPQHKNLKKKSEESPDSKSKSKTCWDSEFMSDVF